LWKKKKRKGAELVVLERKGTKEQTYTEELGGRGFDVGVIVNQRAELGEGFTKLFRAN
jgi:hypothetical protein